jgi:hypothetical protein
MFELEVARLSSIPIAVVGANILFLSKLCSQTILVILSAQLRSYRRSHLLEGRAICR